MDKTPTANLLDEKLPNGLTPKCALLAVCVDAGSDSGITLGRLYNCYQKEPCRFCGYANLFLLADQLLNALGYLSGASPAVTREQRKASGEPAKIYHTLPQLLKKRGERYEFYIYVYRRDHATWQGVLVCPGRRESLPFRSALELLYLIQQYERSLTAGDGRRQKWAEE